MKWLRDTVGTMVKRDMEAALPGNHNVNVIIGDKTAITANGDAAFSKNQSTATIDEDKHRGIVSVL